MPFVYPLFNLLSHCLQVEAILINIFGGIVNCAIIAKGITKACRELELKVPLVVRLEGGNAHKRKSSFCKSVPNGTLTAYTESSSSRNIEH